MLYGQPESFRIFVMVFFCFSVVVWHITLIKTGRV